MIRFLTLLIVFLTITTNAQEPLKGSDYVLHPKCLKYESEGKEEIEQCFFRNLVEDVSAKTMYLLQVNKIAYIDLKTQVKFTINEEGEFEHLEFFGSDINKKLVKESFESYLIDYSKKKKKLFQQKMLMGFQSKNHIIFHFI